MDDNLSANSIITKFYSAIVEDLGSYLLINTQRIENSSKNKKIWNVLINNILDSLSYLYFKWLILAKIWDSGEYNISLSSNKEFHSNIKLEKISKKTQTLVLTTKTLNKISDLKNQSLCNIS